MAQAHLVASYLALLKDREIRSPYKLPPWKMQDADMEDIDHVQVREENSILLNPSHTVV